MAVYLGALIALGGLHLLIIFPSLINLFRSGFAAKSKLGWFCLIVFMPIVGVALIHWRHGIGWFLDKPYELSVQNAIARSNAQDGGNNDAGG